MDRLPEKLYCHKELLCGARRYPRGSALRWQDEGLDARRVHLLLKTRYLGEKQWPGHREGEPPLKPIEVEIEDGPTVASRHKQERETKQARQDLLEERERMLRGEGLSESHARSQAAGELAAYERELGKAPDYRDLHEQAKEEAQRRADEQAERQRLAELEREAAERAEAEAKAHEEEAARQAKAEAEEKLLAEMEAEEKAEAGMDS